MRKFLYAIIVILVILILADRVLKVYEKIAADREIKTEQKGNPVLTTNQIKDYARAGQFRLVPYTVFALKPNFTSETVNINSLGLRGKEVGEKPEACYRVAVIGGSAVFGGTVPGDAATFCGVLERDLKVRLKKDTEVINAGIPAFVSMQELILMEDKIIELKPELIVVFDGFNDMLTILKRETRPNYPWWFSEVERVYYKSVTKLFLEKKLKKYRPTKHLLKWINKKKSESKKISYEINHEQIRYYARNLDLMCHLAASYGIKIVLVFQPVLPYKKPLTPAEKKILDSLDPEYVSALKKMCDLGKKAMRQVAEENGVIFVDGTKFFDGIKRDIFVDEVHFNQDGHKLVGDLLAEKINP